MAYETRPELSAITLEMSLNREGLVADSLFPLVKTACKFGVIDWTEELLGLKSIEDHVTCKSDANEIDTGALKIKDYSTKDHALMQVLDECCVPLCGMPNAQVEIEMQKTRELTNKLLIGREERAIALATDLSKYTDMTATTPYASGAVIDGAKFKITPTNFADPTYGLLRWFQGINENALYGHRNLMVTDRATLNGLLRHPTFVGQGCVVDPTTSAAAVADLLGVGKIVVADAIYNDGVGSTPTLKKLWPANTILFTTSLDFITSQDPKFAFGLSAHTQGFEQFTWVDEKKGKGAGARMQKVGHDMTECVLSYKAATIVSIST